MTQLIDVDDPPCPLPLDRHPAVLLGHGGGGLLSRQLVEGLVVPSFANEQLAELHDGAIVDVGGVRLALSTDSFVVSPPFFPGGDVGTLAVHGTVNDLAMCGARPLHLTVGLILEEGFPMADLWRVVCSMRRAAADAGVTLVTGDTKVVERGRGDGIYINTSGLGVVLPEAEISPRRARPGDAVILSGGLAVHGVAVMAVREGLEFDSTLCTDSAPLNHVVADLLADLGGDVHVLRDPTRGGLASALNEIAASAGTGIEIDESAVPVPPEVAAACDLLGLDPLHVANEGKFVAIVAAEAAGHAVDVIRRHPEGTDAAVIGQVVSDHPKRVTVRSRIGGHRILDMLSGEQLPRIC